MKTKLLLLLLLVNFSMYAQTANVPAYVPKNGLIAYYPFDGNANDESGNTNNGTINGASLTPDRLGNANSAYNFDGLTNYIDATISQIPQNNSARTISGWFKTNDAFTDPNKFFNCIFNYGTLSKLQRLSLNIYSKGYLEPITGSDFSNDDFYVNNFDYSNNNWYFFTLTYDGTKLSLYANGKFVDQKAVNLNTIGKVFRIGQRISGDNVKEGFKGTIDDIGIWNRVLTADEISAMYTPVVSYTSIPDANFEQKLINLGIDTDGLNGKVLTNNISTVTFLDLTKSNISDLTGIQGFVSLTDLYCGENALTALNVSKNTALTTLDCNNNRITSLDVSNNIALLNLSCYSNQLTALDVKVNTALTKLNSGSNKYTALDVSSNTALTFLGCNTSQLTTLDVSKNTALTLLDCRENKITNLDVSKLIALTELYCQSNQLKSLDVSKNKSLEFINCSKNQLTTLDISVHPAAIGLYANSNQLTSVNLKNGNNVNFQLLYLNLTNNPNLSCIEVDDKVFSDANWSTKKDATATYNTSCEDRYTLIPDANFENKLISLGIDSGVADGKILTSKVNTLTSLDLAQSSITDLTGIEAFVALNTLNCSNNRLTKLNVSKNTALTSLQCNSNQLSALDLSNNPLLLVLECSHNNILGLNFTNNTALKTIKCDDNFLNNIDLSKQLALENLDINFNRLQSLDLSSNVNLQSLICNNNSITKLDLSKNNKLTTILVHINELKSLNIKNGANNLLYNPGSAIRFDYNLSLSCIQVDNEKEANARWFKQKNPEASFSIDCSAFTLIPDANFEKALIEKGIDFGTPNGKILTSKVSSVTDLFISSKSISDLTGIQDFKSLINLECDKNQLTSIDVSKNTALNYLSLGDNHVKNLDVSKNTALTDLYFHNNQITSIDVSKNTALQMLYFTGNSITNIDVTQNIALTHLYCNSNQLTTLDISKNIGLTNLFCDHNQLTNLDVSKNTVLDAIYCNSNQLKTLDTSKNTILIRLECDSNQLTSLDVSKNPLNILNCESNLLTSLDISKNTNLNSLKCGSNQLISLNLKNGKSTLSTNTLNLKNNPNLTCIQVDDVAYANANWTNAKDATAAYNTNCTVEYVLLPDANFEQKLINLGIDTDGLNGKITTAGANSITSLDLSNSNIKDLSGIEYFTSLTSLDVSNNQLTTLDLSKNLVLEILNASSNQLTTLDFSKNTKLTIVYVINNPLTSLNLRNGNNTNIILPTQTAKQSGSGLYTSFLGLTALGCIQVDDADYSNAKWSKIKEPTTTYSTTCKNLGIEESVFDKAVLYPNPTKGEVTINNITLEKANVYNTLGQLVKSFSLSATNTDNTINLSGLPKGVYYIYLINQDAASAKKIIIE